MGLGFEGSQDKCLSPNPHLSPDLSIPCTLFLIQAWHPHPEPCTLTLYPHPTLHPAPYPPHNHSQARCGRASVLLAARTCQYPARTSSSSWPGCQPDMPSIREKSVGAARPARIMPRQLGRPPVYMPWMEHTHTHRARVKVWGLGA